MGRRFNPEFQRETGLGDSGRNDNVNIHGFSFNPGYIVLHIDIKIVRLAAGKDQGSREAAFTIGEGDLLPAHLILIECIRIGTQGDCVFPPSGGTVESGILVGYLYFEIADEVGAVRSHRGHIGSIITAIILDKWRNQQILVDILDIDALGYLADEYVFVGELIEVCTGKVFKIDLDRSSFSDHDVGRTDVHAGAVL